MSIFGGYKTQTVSQVANMLSAYDGGEISLSALRVYFATLVSVASREAAKRSNLNNKTKQEVIPRYLVKELSKTTGMSLKRVKKELLILKKLEILIFGESEIVFETSPMPGSFELGQSLAGNRSPFRPVPLPRPLLRFLSSCSKASIIKTALAYCLRGLTLSRIGEIKGKGSVKATSIAQVMNLSERSVRSARSELLELGWLVDDEGSKQWKLNRDGAYFEINLMWTTPQPARPARKENSKKVINPDAPVAREGSEGAHSSPAAERVTVDNFFSTAPSFAPPTPEKCINFAPPYKDKKTSSYEEYKNQKARKTEPPGVWKTKKEKSRIYDVKLEDLGLFNRVEELFFQAVKIRLIEPTEAGAINFLAAAVRAKSVSGDAPRVFMGIVRGKLWKNITQADEDRALAALRKYRAQNPDRFRFESQKLAA